MHQETREYAITYGVKDLLLSRNWDVIAYNPPGSQGTFTIPNPAKENIQLIGNKKEKSIVKIYNNMGQLELQTTLNTGNEFINIEQLNNGIYILMIETQQNETIHRSKLKIEK